MLILRGILLTLLAVAVSGLIGTLIDGQIVLHDGWEEGFWPRMQYMLVLTILIERSTEVYLNVTSQNGTDRFRPEPEGRSRDGTIPATAASLTLGILVALAGVRLMETIGAPAPAPGSGVLAAALWYGVDIVVSGGLLAGGAKLFHEVAELIRGGLLRLSGALDGSPSSYTVVPADSTKATTHYTVNVSRTSQDTGKLSFSGGGVSLNTTCWWDPERKIRAGTYLNCSKTRMATKTDSVTGEKRPGIFLPTAVAPDTGNNTIFLHEGNNPSWSDGCIVLDRDEMMKTWNAISPMDGRNVTVIVIDS